MMARVFMLSFRSLRKHAYSNDGSCMTRIFVIEDDEIMNECIVRAIQKTVLDHDYSKAHYEFLTFSNAIDAMNDLNRGLPDLIFLDVLLNGPNGFSFLNELVSYTDTMRIPIIIISSLDLNVHDFSHYGVIEILQKETMTPEQIGYATRKALQYAQ